MKTKNENNPDDFFDFSGLSYGEIENIYQELKFDIAPALLVGVLISILIACFNLLQVVIREAGNVKDG